MFDVRRVRIGFLAKLFSFIGVFSILAFVLFMGGWYTIPAGTKGVVFRLGKINSISDQGFHFKIPFADVVTKINTESVRRLEFGFRTTEVGPPARYSDVPEESAMLTKDNKIVMVDWVMQYQVNRPEDIVLNLPLDQGVKILRDIAESQVREIVASTSLDDILTIGKEKVQGDAKVAIQRRFDNLNLGIFVSSVQLQDTLPPEAARQAFEAVNSARAERESMVLGAQKYANEILSAAKGDAKKTRNDGEAYRMRKVNEATGEASRLLALGDAFTKNPTVLKYNLWMETMTSLWPTMTPIVVEGGNMLPIMDLGKILVTEGGK